MEAIRKDSPDPTTTPTATPTATPAAAARPLVIASYNVHKGVGLDMRRDPHRTTRVIGEIAPDIIALQEVDRRFGARKGVLDLDRLRDQGLEPLPLSRKLGTAAHGWHGNLVLLRGAEVEDVHPVDLPGLEPRGAILADLKIGGQPLRIIAAHLGLLHGSRLEQARMLAGLQKGGDGRPTILMGDLNEWRQGPGCSLGPLKEFYGADGHRVPSYPARLPVLSLDRIFTCNNATVLDVRPHDTPLARVASDHLPIKAQVRFASAAEGGAQPA